MQLSTVALVSAEKNSIRTVCLQCNPVKREPPYITDTEKKQIVVRGDIAFHYDDIDE